MDCREFQSLIPSFIDDTLEDDIIEKFIMHAKECKKCYEELEIHYMLYEGLDKLENDIGASFDLKGELENKLGEYEEYVYSEFKIRVIGSVVSAVAQITLWVCVLLYIFRLF